MDNWNPMEDAYNDKSFNSYDRGPGRNMPADPSERRKCTNLYIRGLPQALNEEGVRNLFSKYGNIISCKIRRTPNYATNIAFVMMDSVEQCSEAIHNLNGHKIGNDRMSVEFAKSQEEKERDRQEKERQEQLIRSLGSGRTVTNSEQMSNGSRLPNLKISISNSNANASPPRMPANGNPSLRVGYSGGRSADPLAGGDMVAHNVKPRNDQQYHTMRENNGPANGYSSDTGAARRKTHYNSPHPATSASKDCEQCGKADSSYQCSKCQAVHYCSPTCQSTSWPTHKLVCKPPNQNSQPNTAPKAPASSPAVHSQRPNVISPPAPAQTLPVSASSLQLPLKKAVKVKLVEFQSPARFFVQLVDNVDLLRLQATLNQQCIPYAPDTLSVQAGDLLAVQLATGVWHRGLVIASRKHQYFIYLVDIGQKHFTNIICPIPSEVSDIPFQAIECSLYGLVPYKGGTWTDFAVQACTKFGLNAGDLYSVTCVSTTVGNQVMFTLPDESDLGDKLVEATAALVDPQLRYTVWDSLHRRLSIGSAVTLRLEDSSIEGVDGFYATIGNDQLRPYLEAFGVLEYQMTEYGNAAKEANIWNEATNRIPVLEEHVLCLYEGSWSRGVVVNQDLSTDRLVVAFTDFGNISLVSSGEVLHLPREFSHIPAIAVKVHVDGITDSTDEAVKERARLKVSELTIGGNVQAVVKDLNLDTLSVKISNADGSDFGSTLLAANVAVRHDQPLEDSLILSAPTTPSVGDQNVAQAPQPAMAPPSPSPIQSPLTPPAYSRESVPGAAASSSPGTKPAVQTLSDRVSVIPLLSPGNSYKVKLRKLDRTLTFCVSFPLDIPQQLDQLTKDLASFYSSTQLPVIQKPCVGDFLVFQLTPGQWRRGCVLRVSTANRVTLIQHLDYAGETSKVVFDRMLPLVPRFAHIPFQSLPVCQLENIKDVDQKNALLKPYMQFEVRMEVIEYENYIYTVRISCDKSASGNQSTGRKYWMAGTDIPFVTVPDNQFTGNILHVVSPAEIYFSPANLEEARLCLTTVAEQSARVANDPPASNVKEGEVVFAYCSQYGEWDRAIIVEILANHMLSVQSADFGSTYTAALADVRLLDETTASLPLRAIRCSLAGVRGIPTNAACDYIMRLNECKVTMQVVDCTNGLQVTMVDSNGVNVVDMVNGSLPGAACSAAAGPGVTTPAGAAAVQGPPSAQPLVGMSAQDQQVTLMTLLQEIASLKQEVLRLRQERED